MDAQQYNPNPTLFPGPVRPVVKFSPAVFVELSKGYPQVPHVIDSDGKEHLRFRKAVSKAFAPKRVKQPESFIKEVVTSLVDAFIYGHKAEVISQYYAWYRALMGITTNGRPAAGGPAAHPAG